MRDGKQSGKYTSRSSAVHGTPLVAAAVVSSPLTRTFAIAAAISLAAFALYMIRPQTHISSTPAAAHKAAESPPASKPVTLPTADAGSAPSQATGSGGSNTTVTINGKNIPATPSGNVDKTVKDGGSTTTVHVSSEGNGTATNTVNIESNTTDSPSSGGGT